jgi:hypothetical protein
LSTTRKQETLWLAILCIAQRGKDRGIHKIRVRWLGKPEGDCAVAGKTWRSLIEVSRPSGRTALSCKDRSL